MPVRAQVLKQAKQFNLPLLGRWIILGGLVGLVAGLGAIAFHFLCTYTLSVVVEGLAGFRPPVPAGEATQVAAAPVRLHLWLILLAPAFGGLLSGLLVYFFAPEAEGHGTDAAIEAFHMKRGHIRARIPFVKPIASALTIGTGGSGGREGPIAQIGAGFGSYLAVKLHLPERDRRILLAAGVGAGVGSIFRAPLAGALFAAEILYSEPEFESDVVIPAALSTIVAYCVFSIPFGFGSLFDTPPFSFHSPLELIPYTALALVVALAAGLFVKTFYAIHDRFKRLPILPHFKPMLGGLATGGVAVLLYLALGTPKVLDVLAFGYGSLQQAFMGQIPIYILLALAGGKILTTSLTIGSGGSGGVFGPSMVIGGCLGGVVGILAQKVMPGLVPEPGTYIVVGMAGFFAAAANTPISTLVMVSEMTGNYQLLLPALWVCCIAFLLGRRWSLYRSQVPTRLQSPAHRHEFYVDVLEDFKVGDLCPGGPLNTIPENASLHEVMQTFAGSDQEFFPVIDASGKTSGLISLRDIRRLLEHREEAAAVIARDIANVPKTVLSPADPVSKAMQQFTSEDVSELPVVHPDHPTQIMAMLSRRDLMEAYNRGRLDRIREQLATKT
ncbi:MAG: chloride channel protein [Acidobacteriota bacterium]